MSGISEDALGPQPLPVTVIGGYLGVGKTTLVNHLLRNAGGRRLAILVNEFGELAIDEDLIEAEGDDMIAIAGGCICCSFGNDLIGALGQMAAMRPPPDHVVIESSGVAIPGAIVATAGLIAAIRVDATVVVADAETVERMAADEYLGDTITRQLADADIVVMNKCDLADAGADRAEAWVQSAAPGAAVLRAVSGAVDPGAVLGIAAQQGARAAGHHADGLFDSMAIAVASGPVTRGQAEALAEALARGPLGVVRAKGYLAATDGVFRLHSVGRRWQIEPAGEAHDIGVICIGPKDRFDRAGIKELVASLGL